MQNTGVGGDFDDSDDLVEHSHVSGASHICDMARERPGGWPRLVGFVVDCVCDGIRRRFGLDPNDVG